MKRLLSPTVFCLLVLPVLVASAVAVLMAMPSAPEAAQYAAVLPLAYLFGSIPWGYFFLYWRRGLDIREYGSGRIGVSNVLRTGGGGVAALVLLLDLSKSVVMVLLARELIGTTTAEVTVGLMALLGHNWPVFLKFRGGRGIVTGLGGLSVMAPLAAAIAAVAFIPTTLISRYLSLGSITGVVAASLSLLALTLAGVYSSTYAWYGFIGGGIIIWQHRDNIQRLLRGTERRLGNPAARLP